MAQTSAPASDTAIGKFDVKVAERGRDVEDEQAMAEAYGGIPEQKSVGTRHRMQVTLST